MALLPVTALVLAGGKSARLGRDKAFAAVNGRPLLDRVTAAVGAVCSNTLIVADDATKFAAKGVTVIPDATADEGPLMGLRSGLEAMTTDWGFATSCDAPFLSPRLIEYLWRLREGHDAVVPFTAADQYPKPLCALYSRTCLHAILETLGRGERRMIDFYPFVHVLLVPEDSVRLIDPYLLSFHNVNTPEDLALAEEIARIEDAPE